MHSGAVPVKKGNGKNYCHILWTKTTVEFTRRNLKYIIAKKRSNGIFDNSSLINITLIYFSESKCKYPRAAQNASFDIFGAAISVYSIFEQFSSKCI